MVVAPNSTAHTATAHAAHPAAAAAAQPAAAAAAHDTLSGHTPGPATTHHAALSCHTPGPDAHHATSSSTHAPPVPRVLRVLQALRVLQVLWVLRVRVRILPVGAVHTWPRHVVSPAVVEQDPVLNALFALFMHRRKGRRHRIRRTRGA